MSDETIEGRLSFVADHMPIVGSICETGIEVLGSRADDDDTIAAHLHSLSELEPDLVLDNGAELIELLAARGHAPRGATEETTSGALTLRGPLAGKVPFPVAAWSTWRSPAVAATPSRSWTSASACRRCAWSA